LSARSSPPAVANRRLDPTGNGGIVAGFGDLREVELLVEAGLLLLKRSRLPASTAQSFSARMRASARLPSANKPT